MIFSRSAPSLLHLYDPLDRESERASARTSVSRCNLQDEFSAHTHTKTLLAIVFVRGATLGALGSEILFFPRRECRKKFMSLERNIYRQARREFWLAGVLLD